MKHRIKQLLPILAAFFYYATPQNKWEEKLRALFPDHAVVVDDGNDNSTFFEGIAPGQGEIPYGAWVEPSCLGRAQDFLRLRKTSKMRKTFSA